MTSRARSVPTRATPAPPAEPAEGKTNPLFLPPEDLPPTLPQGLPPHLQAEKPPQVFRDPPSSMTDPGDAVPVVGSPSVTPSTDKPPSKITRGGIRKYAKRLVMVAGKIAQQRLTMPDSIERADNLWMPDEEDAQDIANPIAGLVARRIPAGAAGASGNPDVEDGIFLLVAVVAYVLKQVERRQSLRQLYSQVTPDLTANDVEAVPA